MRASLTDPVVLSACTGPPTNADGKHRAAHIERVNGNIASNVRTLGSRSLGP